MIGFDGINAQTGTLTFISGWWAWGNEYIRVNVSGNRPNVCPVTHTVKAKVHFHSSARHGPHSSGPPPSSQLSSFHYSAINNEIAPCVSPLEKKANGQQMRPNAISWGCYAPLVFFSANCVKKISRTLIVSWITVGQPLDGPNVTNQTNQLRQAKNTRAAVYNCLAGSPVGHSVSLGLSALMSADTGPLIALRFYLINDNWIPGGSLVPESDGCLIPASGSTARLPPLENDPALSTDALGWSDEWNQTSYSICHWKQDFFWFI